MSDGTDEHDAVDDSGPVASPESGMRCPFCGSGNTRREARSGPALCRTVHYCDDCEQPFEEFS